MAKMLTKMTTSVYNKNSEDVNNDYNDGVCVKYVKKTTNHRNNDDNDGGNYNNYDDTLMTKTLTTITLSSTGLGARPDLIHFVHRRPGDTRS